MTDETNNTGHAVAQAMLDAFASVGATRFDVTSTTRAGEKEWFRRGLSVADVRRTIPAMLDAACPKQHNVIVRPSGPRTTFIQLDDLQADQLTPLTPAVFLALETSPGNFQAWVALSPLHDKDFARRLRKGTGADATASGATRVAGSLNFKDKYAPDFPRVAIHAVNAGRITTVEILDHLGLVAAPESVAEPARLSPAHTRPGPGNRRWPSYARCLDGAPLNSEETGPDTSRADFVWCMTALTWGWGKEEIVARLMEESSKARTNGRGYADVTVRNAVLAVERRREQPRRHGIG